MTERNAIAILPLAITCPICSSAPYVEECWHKGPWAVGCYKMLPFEHFVGVNGDSRLDAIREWNIEAVKVAALSVGEQLDSSKERLA